MGKFKDLTGTSINNWKVIEFAGINKYGASTWRCECMCDKNTVKVMSQQILKKSKNCGCGDNLAGITFNEYIVISRVENLEYLNFKRKTWNCKCVACGSESKISETRIKNNPPHCACYYKKANEFLIDGENIIIRLQNNVDTIISKFDYDIIKNDWWIYSKDGYVVSSSGENKSKRMHRVILGLENSKGIIVDHINRNRLDNRRDNLRMCNDGENARNQSIRKNNKSGIIGVSWWSRDNNWMAQIKYNYKRIFLGYFDDINDAIRARLEGELKYFGKDFAPQRHLFEKYGIKEDIYE